MTKVCTSCGIEKPLNHFHKETRGKFGVKSKCAICITNISKEWKKQNSIREQINRKNWNLKNQDRHKQVTYQWRTKNKDRHNNYVADYQKNRKNKDPRFKFLSNLRSLLYNHLTRQNIKKHNSLEFYLGCSFGEFKAQIENHFTLTMSWDNYGTYWSIDHICPCNQAKTEDELIKLQNYRNLRPMETYGIDGNFAKSDNKTPEAEQLCIQLLERPWID